jgi:hypothetical protein
LREGAFAANPIEPALKREAFMPFVTADVVATPGGETPFKVVFKQGETVLIEWEVDSQQEGEEQIVECIKSIEDDGD